MKKFFKIIGIILLLAIIFVLVAGLLISKDYHFERDITINAPKEKVWSHVNSLGALTKWSPWLDKDPAVQTNIEGQDGAIGSVFKWKGNKDVGEGTQTLTKLEAPNRVDTHLHFIEPFDGQADAHIDLADAGTGTKVTWGFDMKYTYPMNVMKLFMNMDDLMGKDYSNGLNKLKSLSEAN
jgi:Polyketide cyclase / dehydrase and lipid transport